jgi:hypothetical protein
MNEMRPQDWLWIASLLFGALNAWQNKSIKAALLELQLSLVDRIGKAEADLREIRGTCNAVRGASCYGAALPHSTLTHISEPQAAD